VKFGTYDFHIMVLSNFEFHDNQCSDKSTLLWAYMNLYLYFPHLLPNFGEIQH